MKKKEKKEKKKLGFKKTVANNLFALKAIVEASPLYFIVYLGSSVVDGVLAFLSEAYLLRKVVNGVENGEDMRSILTYVVILGAVMILSNQALNWFWNVKSPAMQRKIAASIEGRLFRQSARVELACYETPSFYDRYVRALDEAYYRIQRVLASLDRLLYRVIGLSANSLLLFIIDPWLIVFAVFPLLLGFLSRLDNVLTHEHQVEQKPINRRAEYVRRTFYLGEYAKEMRIGGMYTELLNAFNDTFKDFKALLKKYGFKRTIIAYTQKIGLEVVAVLGATTYAVWSTMCVGADNGGMLIGDCIVVLSSIGSISFALSTLVQNVAEFGEHALFLEDVRYFLDYEPKIVDGEKEVVIGGELEVKNLCFKYEGAENDTLKDINFTLHKGERIALVGSNGSGKTTLVKLLLRLYDPSSGEITLNGENIKDFKLDGYRGSFSTVFQDFKMFSLSVSENVLLRPLESGDKEKVEEALKQSGIYDKLMSLENGLDSILTREFDDKGANLSIGEQQKLSLARVFADNTPFVILDEPSSALDPIAEYTMFENMMKATEGRSVIFISHRLSSAVLADRVILMDNGTIAEMGTHSELLHKNGKYAAMFRKQAENYLGSEVAQNV